MYQRAAIFVLSSRYDGFGLVLIEAMSQGCACVACDYKGRQSEIISSQEQGIICEPDNVDALAKAMLTLINDENKRNKMGIHAIARASDFTIDKIVELWDDILKDIH